MSRKCLDLNGQKFGRLTVIKRTEDHIQQPSGKHAIQYLCRCECGNEVTVRADSLKSGNTTSCGCFNREKVSAANKTHKKTHGLTHSRLYKIWRNMKGRCYNQNKKAYKNYGNRGIKVCDEWLYSFESFYNWSISNRYDENAEFGECTIDRINVNGNYETSNCRWISNKEQQRNKRNNRLLTINGETMCLVAWCELLNLNYNTVHTRLSRGWSPERALERI